MILLDDGAQRDGGSAVAAKQRLRQWRQRDSATSAAAWWHQRWRQREAQRWRTAER
jgi:hypothetical protein